MEETRKLQREKFACALLAFDDVYNEFDNLVDAFDNADVRQLFELAFSAYLEWKNYVEEMK